jgi:hypothetical protein
VADRKAVRLHPALTARSIRSCRWSRRLLASAPAAFRAFNECLRHRYGAAVNSAESGCPFDLHSNTCSITMEA